MYRMRLNKIIRRPFLFPLEALIVHLAEEQFLRGDVLFEQFYLVVVLGLMRHLFGLTFQNGILFNEIFDIRF